MPSTAARIRSETFPIQPNQILSFFSSQMEANLLFQKKKEKCCCHTHKLMVTLSLLQIPHAEAFKEIVNFPYHEHLPAPEDEKKKQLLENIEQNQK